VLVVNVCLADVASLLTGQVGDRRQVQKQEEQASLEQHEQAPTTQVHRPGVNVIKLFLRR